MDFTQEQITTILSDFSSKKENGYETILKIALESLMRAEREEFKELNSDVSNGFRKRSKTIAQLNFNMFILIFPNLNFIFGQILSFFV